MLKFISNHMETIQGVAFWPALGFVIFFTFFLGVLWWTFTVDRGHLDHMASTPLNDNITTDDHEA